MSTQALAVVQKEQGVTRPALLEPNSLQELNQLGSLMAASGFFADAREAAKACVKILAGREMGFPPIASMVGISVIEGKPALGANLIAAAMKRGGYTWVVDQRDAKGCRLTVHFRGQKLGPSEFLEEDAKRANLLDKKNWRTFPRSMYFARAITDAARTYAPEVLAGMPAYTADELGAEDTAEDGSANSAPSATQQQTAERRIAEEQQKTSPKKKAAPDPAPATVVDTKAEPNGKPRLDDQVPTALQALWEKCGSQKGIEEALGDLCGQMSDRIGDEAAQEQFNRALMTYGLKHWKQATAKQARLLVRDLYTQLQAMEAPPSENPQITDADVPLFIQEQGQ